MKYGHSDSKEQVLKRLKRAEGQVRGVARMVEEDKYCIDVLTQISAAQAARFFSALWLSVSSVCERPIGASGAWRSRPGHPGPRPLW